jgi:hypothetical protein
MSCLKKKAEFATGDPTYCQSCKAIFNKFSKAEPNPEGNGQIWSCEFCNHKNFINLEAEEMPKTDTVNYIIDAATVMEDEKKDDELAKDISVVYCIDVSGSMNMKSGGKSRLECVQETISGQLKDTFERYP